MRTAGGSTGTTLTRLLRRMGARWGRRKLFVECPWSKRRRQRRVAQIRAVLEDLSPDQVAVCEGEVDINLNPKSGPDWLLKGVQKWVRAPSQNKKLYLTGDLNRSTGSLVWVDGVRKRSHVFLDRIEAVARNYRRFRRIHLILHNYSIHTSRAALQRHEGRVLLHVLPPFCPDENPIERLWQDLHARRPRRRLIPPPGPSASRR